MRYMYRHGMYYESRARQPCSERTKNHRQSTSEPKTIDNQSTIEGDTFKAATVWLTWPSKQSKARLGQEGSRPYESRGTTLMHTSLQRSRRLPHLPFQNMHMHRCQIGAKAFLVE